MQDKFNDSKFDSWLYGGVHDLDEDIGNLIYEIYRSKHAETIWSCSGHIGVSLMDVGTSKRRETHWVYHPGLLFFNQSNLSQPFFSHLKSLVKTTHFARISDPIPSIKEHYSLYLEMDDLINMSELEFYKANPFMPKEIEIGKAVERYEEFKKFWNELESIVKKI